MIAAVLVISVVGLGYSLITIQQPLQNNNGGMMEITQIIQNPREYTGRSVEVNGLLVKELSLGGTPFMLTDGESLILLRSDENLDKYLGLDVKITGVVDFNPDIFGRPATSLDILELNPIDAEPAFFLEIRMDGIDDRGRPVIGRQITVDNNRMVVAFDTISSQIFFKGQFSNDDVESLAMALVENGFFEMQNKKYPSERGSIVYTYNLKAIVDVNGELKENTITWFEPATIPDNLFGIESALEKYVLKVVG